MRVDDALRQIEAIHDHLDKGEVYRGLHVAGVVEAGCLGLIAAALQDHVVGRDDFVAYWVVVAAVCGCVTIGSVVWSFATQDDSWSRRKTLRLACQFVPCVLGGAAITLVFSRACLEAFLPGLWALVFGLGLLAARPYLPRAIGWVCLYYLVVGCVLLLRSHPESNLYGWQVGGVFGLGHLASALVLSRNVERDDG